MSSASSDKTTNQDSNNKRSSATPEELAALKQGLSAGISEHEKTFGNLFDLDEDDETETGGKSRVNTLPVALRPPQVERSIVVNAMKMMKIPGFTVDRWGLREESPDYWRGALDIINLMKTEEDRRNEKSLEIISDTIGPMNSVLNDLKNEILSIKAKIGGSSGADEKILKDLREIKDMVSIKTPPQPNYQSAHVSLINDRDVKPEFHINKKPESVMEPGAIKEMESHMRMNNVSERKIRMVSEVIKSLMFLEGGQNMFLKIMKSDTPEVYLNSKWDQIENKYTKLVAKGKISG